MRTWLYSFGAATLSVALVGCGGGSDGATTGLGKMEVDADEAGVAPPARTASSDAPAPVPARAASAPQSNPVNEIAVASDAAKSEIDTSAEKAGASGRVPVYRFYNTRTATHFYTASAQERDHVLVTWPQFSYEGVAFSAYPYAVPGTSAVYRFYNARTGTHFYTISEVEREDVRARLSPPYSYEGPTWYAAVAPDGATRTPIYRFYNTITGAHFYTVSAAERAAVLAKYPQFSDEKIGYYVWPGEGTGDPLPQLPPPPWTPAATFTTLPNLSISSFKPAAIQIRDYEGAPSMVNGPTLISAMIAGDLRTLNGKTPFVYAVDPNNLFSLYTPWTALFHTSGQGGVSFGLQLGNALAGTYKGGVNIYICSTQDCSVRLGNVPASFPYDIVLKRNTRFEASNATTIAASVPFGAQTQKLAFRIDPPEGTPIGGLELHPAYSPLNVKSTLRDDGDGKGTLLLEIPPATPIGRYSLQYGFSTKSTVAYVPMRMLTVTLDVVPNEQEPYVFSPPSMTMSSSLANGVYYQTDGVNVTQAQGTLALALPRAEEILYTPAQEAAIPPENRGRFIEASKRDYQVNPSTVTVLLNHTACIRSTQTTPTGALKTICVPSGEYAFRIKFNYTNNGTTVPLYYHGTMTVTP